MAVNMGSPMEISCVPENKIENNLKYNWVDGNNINIQTFIWNLFGFI